MNCRRVNNLLSAYIDNEVTGADQLQIRDHLKYCLLCAEEHETLQNTKRMISHLAIQQPRGDLEQEILARITAESNRPLRLPALNIWWGLLPEPQRASLRAAAMFGIFAMVAGLYMYGPIGRETTVSAPVTLAREMPQPPAGPVVPVHDYMMLHNSSEDGLPMSGGATLTPAGMYSQPSVAPH